MLEVDNHKSWLQKSDFAIFKRYRGYHESVFWDRKYPALGINIVFCEPWRAKYIVFIPNAGYLRSQNTRA